jgi:hypothetical protein
MTHSPHRLRSKAISWAAKFAEMQEEQTGRPEEGFYTTVEWAEKIHRSTPQASRPSRMERRRCGCTRCKLAGGSAPYRITGSFNPLDQNVGVSVRLLDLVLAEMEVDGRRIVVRYQTLVADGV